LSSEPFPIAVVWDAKRTRTTVPESMGIVAMDGRNNNFTTFETTRITAKIDAVSVGKIGP
jgi:hypothetical protein